MRVGLVLFALLSAFPALAGESGKAPNATPKPVGATDDGSAVQRVAFVSQLIHWSRTTQSVEGLITAAQLAASLDLQQYEVTKTAEPLKGVTADHDKTAGTALTLDPTALLKEAQWYASGKTDKKLQVYVDGVVRAGLASPRGAGGPKYAVTKVNGAYTDVYDISFAAGSIAEIAIAGDGDTDLDLHVYDEFNNDIASDTGSTDAAFVSWTPRWAGKYRIEVRNNGTVHNQYTFVTN